MTLQVNPSDIIGDQNTAEDLMHWIFRRYPILVEKMLEMMPAKDLGLALRAMMSPEALAELKEALNVQQL